MPTYDLGTARGRIELDASDLDRAAASLDFIGRRMIAMGAAAGAGFGYAVKAAAGFETQLSRFSAVSGATEEQMAALSEKALQLGKDSAFGATQVVEGFVEIAKSGLSVQDVLAGVGDAAVTLAAAGELDMARATEILVNTMRQFNLTAEDTVGIADLLAGAANASTVEVEDLAVSLRYVGPVAAAAGISLQSTAEAMAILGNAGIRGSTAGTSLRGILVQLNGSSDKAKKAMRELGIITEDGANKFFDATGKVRSFAEIAQVLQDATKGLTKEQQIQAFTTIFQRRAMAAAITLAREGAEGFRELRESEQFATTAQEVMQEKLDNLTGSLRILKAAVETAAITVGTLFTPYVKILADVLKELVEWFTELPEPIQKMIGFLLVASSAVLLLGGGLALTAGMTVRAFQAFSELGPALRIVGALIRSAGTAVLFLGRALLALFLNPVGLAILAAAALAVGLYLLWTRSETFRNAVKAVGRALKTFFTSLDDAAKAVGRFFQRLAKGVKRGLAAGWERLKDVAAAAFNGIVEAGGATIRFFQRLPGIVIEFLGRVPGLIAGFLADAAKALLFAIGFMIGLWLRLWVELVKLLIEWVPRLISLWFNFWVDFWTTVIRFGAQVLQAVVQFMTQLPGIIARFLAAAFQAFVNFVTNFLSLSVRFGGDFLATVIRFFTQLPGTIWNFLVAAFNFMVRFVGDMIAKAIEVGAGVVWQVAAFFGRLPGVVLDAIRDLPGQLYRAGIDIMQGLLNGLESMMGKVGGFLGGLKDSFVDGITSGFGLLSPSKLTRGYGQNIMEGFLVGMERRRRAWDEMVKQLVTDAENFANNAGVNAVVTSSAATGNFSRNPAALTGVTGTTTTNTSSSKVEKHYDIDIINPEPEPASDSIFRSLAKVAYLGGEDE